MKYSLRSLMIVALVGPPLLASLVMVWHAFMALDLLARELLAYGIATFLPMPLIAKWKSWGMVCSIVIGWSVVYWVHISPSPLLAGAWFVYGPVLMLVWCLPILGLVLLYDGWKRRCDPSP